MYLAVDEKHLFYNNKLLPRLSTNVFFVTKTAKTMASV